MTRRGTTSLIALAVLAAFVPARAAHADQNILGLEGYALIHAPLLVLPSDVGVTVESSRAAFVFGWSLQVPFVGADSAFCHRVAADVNFVVRESGVSSVRWDLGYRYGGRHLFGGAGAGFDGKEVTVSPELGVKFAHAERDYGDGLDRSLHLAARADVTPTTGRLSTTILFGWNLF